LAKLRDDYAPFNVKLAAFFVDAICPGERTAIAAPPGKPQLFARIRLGGIVGPVAF
jgi:hypothetical protein